MNIQKVSINKINPALYNPRKDLKPDDREYKHLVKSMEEYGCVEPLVWNKRTGNLVGGHQRFKVLVAQGLKKIQVSVVNLPLKKEKALNIALNKISGEWDQQKLTELLDELVKSPEVDLESTGFNMPEVEQLFANTLDDTDSDDNFDLEAEIGKNLPIITRPGDLIELGLHREHRLLCGDVTNPSDIAKLIGNSKARLCHTDPPYGVNYDPNNRPSTKRTRNKQTSSRRIQNDDLTPKRYASWFVKVVDVMADLMMPGSPFYIWNSHKNFGLMHDLLTARSFKIASVITWAKESFSPSFGDYNEQIEHCLYGWKTGARHHWYGPRNESTLWKVHRDRTTAYRHPTQKALELAERAIRNSSKAGDIIFDPFLGSGTTLIAAARLGRRCFGLEIEPRYCDCIVRRYIALVGRSTIPLKLVRRYCA
jgi:DNA modification methylase